MVAVSLSEEVRPLPLMQPQEEQVQVGGTNTTTTTGIESVDDHIARLKANARQHVERELNGDSHRPSQSKSPYLPSKEVAKTIKCRFFPNCYYADKCMFFHPSSLEGASHQVPTPMLYQPMIAPQTAAIYGNDHSPINGVQSPNGDNSNLPLSPNGVNIPEEYSNGYEMGYNPNAPNGYYIPNGYEGGSEYNPYAQGGQGYPGQQQPQGSSSQQQQNGQYYGFVPYGVQHGYTPYGAPHSNGYYPQNGGAAYQGMYMSPPPAPQAQFGSPVHQNGVMSPASSSTPIAADPAIIAQGPESTSPANAQETTPAGEAANGMNGETPTSSGMEKSNSAQSGKSSTSTKSKKTKKAAAAAASTNGAAAESSSTPLQQQAQEFVPMQYYGMPSEMMMMMPPSMPQAQHMPAHLQNGVLPHFQPQAYGSFGVPQVSMNGSAVENGVVSPSSAAAGAATLPNGEEKKNGHERIPSLTNGQLHTFFQTSGESVPSSSSTTPANGRNAPSAPRVNGAPPSASTANGASNARFNPSSSTNGSGGPIKRFPPSQFSPTGAPLPRSGPVSNPNHIRGGSRSFDPTSSSSGTSSKPTLPCRYFESRSCRHGDLCHYTHLLNEERAIPSSTEGVPTRMTRDARLLGLNIGSPDGRISDSTPKHPAEFGHASGHSNAGPSGRRLTLNGHNGAPQAPNGFGMPNVNSKGRFVHAPQPSTQGFVAHQQQQQQQQQAQQSQQGQNQNGQIQAQAQQEQKQQQIAALAGSNSADAQEKIQRLISETRNLPSSIPPPATAAQNGPRTTGPRSSAPHPATQGLGARRPPHQGGAGPRGPHGPTSHSHATSQRVPSGEKDFPALAASSAPAPATATAAMERSASNSSSAEKKSDNKEVAAAPVAAAAEAKKEDAPAPAQASAPTPAAPSPAAAAPTPTPAAAPAPAKPAFSWASAAAKAASLPTPPPKKPVVTTKARPSNKETKAEKKEKQQKAKEGNAASAPAPAAAPADKTAASVAAAAPAPAPAETPAAVAEPVAAAA